MKAVRNIICLYHECLFYSYSSSDSTDANNERDETYNEKSNHFIVHPFYFSLRAGLLRRLLQNYLAVHSEWKMPLKMGGRTFIAHKRGMNTHSSF